VDVGAGDGLAAVVEYLLVPTPVFAAVEHHQVAGIRGAAFM
jgi:hypothetical protein